MEQAIEERDKLIKLLMEAVPLALPPTLYIASMELPENSRGRKAAIDAWMKALTPIEIHSYISRMENGGYL